MFIPEPGFGFFHPGSRVKKSEGEASVALERASKFQIFSFLGGHLAFPGPEALTLKNPDPAMIYYSGIFFSTTLHASPRSFFTVRYGTKTSTTN
jgi:hypothetical protein